MTVYIVRHGHSEANEKGFHCGQNQVPLTKKGEEEAENVGKLLRKIKFDKVYSSDLNRANTTGKIALPEYEIEQLPLIREISVGSIDGRDKRELERELGEPLIKNKRIFDFRDYGGENTEMVLERAKKFLDLLAEKGDETVAVFTHEVFIKSLFSAVLGVWVDIHNYICNNCSVMVLTYENEEWKLFSWNIQSNSI
ncbi:MAG: histidine phosphatase family protein [Clostridia bacterium]|nr:histidine phosphatase family protein [Clostridia bacterium]